ncbi:Mitochondrial pyruvate carrier [Lasallia pustulata]|uniref:Mitochondrial pyruvate carrier n=1 Tax=Lasallia pustulata TaxID=136370 RepID=A0A1W5DBW6_9LECA|nr:Mitochondrial pyruvate carrier [Lasallia pustulata]
MTSRAGLRFAQFTRAARASFRQPIGRRFQTTDAAAAPEQNSFQRLWNSPIGIKTVHFWAPVMKWCLVIAGASDFTRPAEKLSLTQNIALTCTGAIWTRWCFIIKPRNLLLAAVNFLLGCVGVIQVTRIFMYQRSLKNSTLPEIAEQDAEGEAEIAKGIAKNPKGAAKKAGVK